MNNYDSIIIGAGPAGISAAIYLKRYNLNPLVINSGSSSLEKATIENYYGIKSISGTELFQNGIEQAKSLGVEVIDAEVTAIDSFNGLTVKTTNGSFTGKTIFLGLGKSRTKLNIKGANDLLGKGISMCATCDGFFFRKKAIGIVGSGKFMEEELDVLKNFTPNITIFTDGNPYTNAEFNVVTDKITEVFGDGKLEGLKTSNSTYNIQGLFVAIGSANASDFANHLGIAVDEKKNIVVDKNYMTNVKGIFAGGDCIGGMLQVVKAVSDGAQAALAIKNYIQAQK